MLQHQLVLNITVTFILHKNIMIIWSQFKLVYNFGDFI